MPRGSDFPRLSAEFIPGCFFLKSHAQYWVWGLRGHPQQCSVFRPGDVWWLPERATPGGGQRPCGTGGIKLTLDMCPSPCAISQPSPLSFTCFLYGHEIPQHGFDLHFPRKQGG